MKVSTENDNDFGHKKITILVDNIPLSKQKIKIFFKKHDNLDIKGYMLPFHVWIKFLKCSHDVSCLKWLVRSLQVYLVHE